MIKSQMSVQMDLRQAEKVVGSLYMVTGLTVVVVHLRNMVASL